MELLNKRKMILEKSSYKRIKMEKINDRISNCTQDNHNEDENNQNLLSENIDNIQTIHPFVILLHQIEGENNNSLPNNDYLLSPIFIPSNFQENLCFGKNCDHDEYSINIPTLPDEIINNKNCNITIDMLIDLGLAYHCQLQTELNGMKLEIFARLVDPLIRLNSVIGMYKIKHELIEQIIYFSQDFEPNPAEMLHTIIEGSSGTGKSHIIDILADIYLSIGYLKKKIIKKVRRSDLIGKYLGHTAAKTQKVIDEALGGILIIDEAYSLGNAEKIGSFEKECIDTINQNLTENAGKFICIIAGYHDELEECFFSYNPGLVSRFRFRYTIDSYKPEDLMEIFHLKINNDKWLLDVKIDKELDFFKTNYNMFKYFGRDMEILLFHTKVAHSNRVFLKDSQFRKIITMKDIKMGMKRFTMYSRKKIEEFSDISRSLYL
uniref:AAA+ ATPase domain-containing protein n=1 Tax=viral metagenome TaxID=1070528 RepID=A0A6C0LRB8_9ZZZZ